MADVGDQNNGNDAPTAPFRKIEPPVEETVVLRWDRSETGESKQPPSGPQRTTPPDSGKGAKPSPLAGLAQPPAATNPARRASPYPDASPGAVTKPVRTDGPKSDPAAPGKPVKGGSGAVARGAGDAGKGAAGTTGAVTTPVRTDGLADGPVAPRKPAGGPVFPKRPAGGPEGPATGGPAGPATDGSSGPVRAVGGVGVPGKSSAVGPVRVGSGPAGSNRPGTGPFRQAESSPPLPGPPPPPAGGLLSRVGDIPIRVVYLIGAIIATIGAVILVFVIFSGDVPKQQDGEDVVQVEPVPSETAAEPGTSGAGLPEVPAELAFEQLPGRATATVGTVTDQRTGISYPRLGSPWQAKQFAPFAFAQRVGKAGVAQPVIASAMLPGATPRSRPESDADYRAIAARAARWTLRTQYPKGATLTWTASQKVPEGDGWMLAFEVTYTQKGAERTGQALVALVDVGKAKPAMLMASIPESGKAYWRDLNTLAKNVRPL